MSKSLQVTSDNKYLWDGVDITEKRTADGGTVLQRYYQQGFVDSDGTVLYYTRDHLGNVRELTDGTQTIRARYDYDSWGRMTKLQGDRDTVIGYAGYFWHSQTGLCLTWYREYDPSLGRWASRDPLGEAGGINLYEYVGNDPTDFTDPDGLKPVPPGRQRWAPCDSTQNFVCKQQCGSRGVQSCMVSQTWRVAGFRNNMAVYQWVNGPMSCSCNDPDSKCPKGSPSPAPSPGRSPSDSPAPAPASSSSIPGWVGPALVGTGIVVGCIVCPECCMIAGPIFAL